MQKVTFFNLKMSKITSPPKESISKIINYDRSFFVNMFCNSKRLVTTSRLFFFHNLAHKKGLGAKEKIKLPFTWSLIK